VSCRSLKSPLKNKKVFSCSCGPGNTSAGEFQGAAPPAESPVTVMSPIAFTRAEPHRGNRGTAWWAQSSARPAPNRLAELPRRCPASCLLVGYGSQGASSRDVAGAFDSEGFNGALIYNSRGHHVRLPAPGFMPVGRDWQSAVGLAVREMIDDWPANTDAGRLRETTRRPNDHIQTSCRVPYEVRRNHREVKIHLGKALA